MKISHEVPICLLEDSLDFNDYQYCLPHLLDQDEDYKNFFYKVKQQGIYIIMDNSLHELGVAYDKSRLIHWINELKPNEFIVPDVWQDTTQSIVNARAWIQVELPKEVTKVAVVQAQNFLDAMLCYQTYKDLGYKKIAFSYGAERKSLILICGNRLKNSDSLIQSSPCSLLSNPSKSFRGFQGLFFNPRDTLR